MCLSLITPQLLPLKTVPLITRRTRLSPTRSVLLSPTQHAAAHPTPCGLNQEAQSSGDKAIVQLCRWLAGN